jgi:hypothetical protein
MKLKPVLFLSLQAALLSSGPAPVIAQTSNQQAPSTPSTPQVQNASVEQRQLLSNTLMDGTPVKLRLDRTISSADEKVGNEVSFDVLEEVKINDVVVIPKGSIATGTVTGTA